MAEIICFPTAYPARQWETRRKIERLLGLLGWDMARCMMGFSADPPDKWPMLDDESLLLMVDYLQEERMVRQLKPKSPRPAAPVATPAKGPAKRLPFPMTPEREARQKATPAAKPKRPKADGPTDNRKTEKARYIRRIKMLQRDCEKALPYFDDRAYRAILDEQFDADTSKALSVPQLRALLLHLQSLLNESGYKSGHDAPALLHRDKTGLHRDRLLWKVQALLAEKGKEEGRYIPWSYALGILERQTGGMVADFEEATPKQINAVIAALAKDGQRKGRRTR